MTKKQKRALWIAELLDKFCCPQKSISAEQIRRKVRRTEMKKGKTK